LSKPPTVEVTAASAAGFEEREALTVGAPSGRAWADSGLDFESEEGFGDFWDNGSWDVTNLSACSLR